MSGIRRCEECGNCSRSRTPVPNRCDLTGRSRSMSVPSARSERRSKRSDHRWRSCSSASILASATSALNRRTRRITCRRRTCTSAGTATRSSSRATSCGAAGGSRRSVECAWAYSDSRADLRASIAWKFGSFSWSSTYACFCIVARNSGDSCSARSSTWAASGFSTSNETSQ